MTKAPERIWAWKYTGDHNNGGWSRSKLSHAEAEYTRTDLSDALIAAAYEAAATACANETWRHIGDDAYSRGMDRGACEQASACAAAIRALTPADARAALERVAQPRWYRMDDAENPPPKDGTRFMAFEGSREAKRYECWWNEDGFSNWDGWLDDWYTNPEPTHWSPLLAPPEDEG